MASNEHAIQNCLSEDELARFHARSLAAPELEACRQHMNSCPQCAARAAQMAAEHERWVAHLQAVGRPPQQQAPGLDDVPGYEISAEISRGGQGIVYRAIQISTKREVALKVLREGVHAAPAARRRFEREIELVAALRHPHIVTVFDSGQTRRGDRYLVMDYVRGRPLGRYLRDEAPDLRRQLTLFAKICEAVNAAHQRGVIHRDLKPSNVLVMEGDEPHVLDFGLARQVGPTDGTLLTTTGQVAGTLPYMSPEQTRALPDAVDIRSDVYALGVMLYEMLTGTFPYPVEGDPVSVLKHIVEDEPTVPHMMRALRAGGQRGRELPLDLRTIVLKALAKERQRRYQTAGDLARDIERYLAGEPIEARRDSNLYLLRKTLQRYRVGVAVAIAFVLVVIASAIGLGIMYTEQARLRNAAEEQATAAHAAEAHAQRRFADVRALANYFITSFDEQIKRLPGSAAARHSLVEKGLEYLELLARDAADDPDLQRELAVGYMTIGDVQGELQASSTGDMGGALNSYRQAERMLSDLSVRHPHDSEIQRVARLNLMKIGDALRVKGAFDEAATVFRAIIDAAEQVLAERPDDAAALTHLGTSHERLGSVLLRQGRPDDALVHYETSVATGTRIPPGAQDPFVALHGRVAGLTNIAEVKYNQGRRDEALADFRAACEAARELHAGYPDDRASRRSLAISCQWTGIILADLGRADEAIAAYNETVAILEDTLRDAPRDDGLQLDLATTLSKLGEAHMLLGRMDDAEAAYRRSLENTEAVARRRPDFAAVQRMLGVAYYKMAEFERGAAQLPSVSKTDELRHWEQAREWLTRCHRVFDEMRERGILMPSDAGVTDELTTEIESITQTIDAVATEATATTRPAQ